MITTKQMENMMGIVMTAGTILSAVIVLLGGLAFLTQYGHDSAHNELMFSSALHIDSDFLWKTLTTFAPLGIIQIGLLTLVATQILRVALLVFYYAATRDYIFMSICLFVLLVILSTFTYNFIGMKT